MRTVLNLSKLKLEVAWFIFEETNMESLLYSLLSKWNKKNKEQSTCKKQFNL